MKEIRLAKAPFTNFKTCATNGYAVNLQQRNQEPRKEISGDTDEHTLTHSRGKTFMNNDPISRESARGETGFAKTTQT